jgi:hypothetical protein
MTIVSDMIISLLPSQTKITPSGWRSFNAVCCSHRGHSSDRKLRGGVIEAGDAVSYHCFNCGFKTGWQPGRHVGQNLKNLLSWLGANDNDISQLSLAVLRLNEGVESKQIKLLLPEFFSTQLPEGSVKIENLDIENEYKTAVTNYIQQRKLEITDTEFYYATDRKYKNRLIIPFYYKGKIVGYTARHVGNGTPKYLTSTQPGYIFNLDNQTYDRQFCILCEGPIDALHVGACALLGSEINSQQEFLLKQLRKDIVVVPDRDKSGKKLAIQAMQLGYQVSLPEWNENIKDINDAVLKYGRLYTLYSIAAAAEQSELKIKLRMKKWFTE